MQSSKGSVECVSGGDERLSEDTRETRVLEDVRETLK